MSDELNIFLEKHQYKLVKKISAGSFGEVYLITGELGVKFALKKIQSKDFQKGDFDIASGLKHGFIMQTFGMEIINECVFVVSEYIENGSLDDYIQQQKNNHQKVDLEIVTGIITQILTAVDFLHRGNAQTIIHRDLKAANILVLGIPRTGVEGAGVTIKVCDFGCARDLSVGKLAETLCGTPVYSAPELIIVSGKLQYNEKVDNWSIGIILYQLITLRFPHDIQNVFQLVQNITTPIPRPPEMEGGEWNALWEVLSGLTKQNPAERLSCAEALRILRGEMKAQELEKAKNDLEWTVAEQKAEKEKIEKELHEMQLKMAELQKLAGVSSQPTAAAVGAVAGAQAGAVAGTQAKKEAAKAPPAPDSTKKSSKKKTFILRDTNMAKPENTALWASLLKLFGAAVDMYQADESASALKLVDMVPAKETVYVASNRAQGGREFLIACRARGVVNDMMLYCGNKAGWEELEGVRVRTAPDSLQKFIQNYILKAQ